jgi:hypothetical protein
MLNYMYQHNHGLNTFYLAFQSFVVLTMSVTTETRRAQLPDFTITCVNTDIPVFYVNLIIIGFHK